MSIDEIIEKQGWTDETVLMLVWQYLEQTSQINHFEIWLERLAREENEET